jgi:hypothetical protein
MILMGYQAWTDSVVLVSPTTPQRQTGKKGHKKAQKAQKIFFKERGTFLLTGFVACVPFCG